MMVDMKAARACPSVLRAVVLTGAGVCMGLTGAQAAFCGGVVGFSDILYGLSVR